MSLVVGIVTMYAVVFGTVYSNTCQPFQMNKNNMNKALIGHSIMVTREKILHECVRDCMSLKRCKSFDYDNIEHTCKLNDVAKSSENSLEFVSKIGSIFSDISELPSDMVGSCGSRPCNGNQICIANGDSNVCKDFEFPCSIDQQIGNGRIQIDAPDKNKALDEASVICDVGYFTCQQRVKCQATGQWEPTGSCTALSSVCLSVVNVMTTLNCSQSQIQIFNTTRSQPDARAACNEIGGQLAKIDEEWKFDAIETLLSNCPALSGRQYWVDGYKDRNFEDVWTFSDGSLVPMSKHFWKDEAPNNYAGNGNSMCFRMIRRSEDTIEDYRFDDMPCSKTYDYICENN